MPDAHATRFFGRRKLRQLSPKRQRLMQSYLPQIAIAKDSPVQNFGYDRNILEIGFGGGEHIAEMANNNPHCGFIGCDVFVNGIANLLTLIESQKLKNIRIFDEDARNLLPLISDGFLSAVYLLFPDPWPKKRHAKRRFLQPQSTHQLARVLKPNGLLKIASDDASYITHALECLTVSPQFLWTAERPKDWLNPPQNHIPTRYEQKARLAERTITYLNFKRK